MYILHDTLPASKSNTYTFCLPGCQKCNFTSSNASNGPQNINPTMCDNINTWNTVILSKMNSKPNKNSWSHIDCQTICDAFAHDYLSRQYQLMTHVAILICIFYQYISIGLSQSLNISKRYGHLYCTSVDPDQNLHRIFRVLTNINEPNQNQYTINCTKLSKQEIYSNQNHKKKKKIKTTPKKLQFFKFYIWSFG